MGDIFYCVEFIDNKTWWAKLVKETDTVLILSFPFEVVLDKQSGTVQVMGMPFIDDSGEVCVNRNSVALRCFYRLSSEAVEIYQKQVEQFKYRTGKSRIVVPSGKDRGIIKK